MENENIENIKEEVTQPQAAENFPIKKQKPWLMIILIILIIVSVGTVGVFAYTNYLLKNSSYAKKDILLTTPIPTQFTTATPITIPTTTPRIALPNTNRASWQTYESGQAIDGLYGLSITYPNGWEVNYRKESNPDSPVRFWFDFAPPDWSPSTNYINEGWMEWGEMAFDVYDFQTDISTWIDKNLTDYKNDLTAKEDTKIGNRLTFFINTKENYQGMWTPRWVILGSKYSYCVGFSQDGANNFIERLQKEIYPTIHID